MKPSCFLESLAFPLEINFHHSFSHVLQEVFFFFPLALQGAEFQGIRTTDIKEKAKLESRLKHTARDTALLREEINLLSRRDRCLRELAFLSRKDGCLFLQPSSPQDSQTPTESFPVLRSEKLSNSPALP